MTAREQDEYSALRATIRERGTVRVGLFVAGMAAWAALTLATAALAPATAHAQTGTLSSGDYTGPAGTQHYELYVPSTYQSGTAVPLVVAAAFAVEIASILTSPATSSSTGSA